MSDQTKSIEELKVRAYDTMAVIERAQQNLQAINQEIAKKIQEQSNHGSKEEVKDVQRNTETT